MAGGAKAASGGDLNDKQKAFARAYVVSLNATEAAKTAGYAESTASQQGYRLKTDPKVRAYIDVLFDERSMGKGEVKARLSDIADGDMGDFIDVDGDEDGALVGISLGKAKAAGKLRLIRKLKITKKELGEMGTITTVDLELYAADKALIALGRHHRLFGEQTPETGEDDEETKEEQDIADGDLATEAALDGK